MSAQQQPADKLIGQVLASRYEIQQKLGEGAMGAVYRARHVKVGRPFAVKVLHPRLLVDAKVALRFEREAELAGRLRHPNVVGVVDIGEVDGTRYMVMDFAEGPDLAQLLVEAPMPGERIIHIVRQMLEGLYHAHERGLIHRDFKPENVIIERDTHGAEVPRIVDFGIAILRDAGEGVDWQGRLTTNGLVLGTPHYMAPEQAVADPIDHRIDLFALGIVIYEMLSGRLPFDGSGAEVARANLLIDPPAIAARVPYLEVDPLLEAFSRRLMAKKRDARPPTAKAARELLDLIERDRRAASEALGVPMRERAAATQPVMPSVTPSVTPPVTPSVTPSVTPPVTAVASGAPGGADDRSRPTAIRTPLGWEAESLTRRRRPWLIAGAILGASGIAAAGMVATAGEPSTSPVERLPRTSVAEASPPPGPAVPVAAAPAPANRAQEPSAVPAPVGSAPVVRAPVPAPGDAVPSPPTITSVPDARTRPTRKIVRPAETRAVETRTETKAVARPPGDGRAAGIELAETRPAETKAIDSKGPDASGDKMIARTGITPRAISDLYYSIPPLLKSLPEGESQDLSERFRLYDVQRLMIESQGNRDKAAADLLQIRNDALARGAKPGPRR